MSFKDQNIDNLNSNSGVSFNKEIEDWAIIVIKNWHEKIIALNINYTHSLYNSFFHHVNTNANGDPIKIEFAFNYYGKFVDMGVGREISKGNSGNLGFTPNRKAKKWYSKEFYRQVMKLKELLAERYAKMANDVIIVNLSSVDEHGNNYNSKTKSGNSKSNTNPTARAYDKVHGN